MKHAMVIGSNGFIARALIEELTRSGIAVIPCDLVCDGGGNKILDVLDRDAVHDAAHGVDWVFNFAGLLGTTELNERAYEAAQVNIIGMINVLDACLSSGVSRLIYPSKPPIWRNIYTATKAAADQIAHVYRCRGLDVRGIIVRNAYGPGQRTGKVRKVVPDMVQRARSSRCIEIYGDGSQPIDLIHVSDIAKIFLAAASLDRDQWSYNTPIESGNTVRVTANELAEIVCQGFPALTPRLSYLPMREGEDVEVPLPLPSGPFAAAVCGLELAPRDLLADILRLI